MMDKPLRHETFVTGIGEDELVDKVTAPRVTEGDVEAAIASEWYFTATDGVMGAVKNPHWTDVERGTLEWQNAAQIDHLPETLSLLTLCVLVLRNGIKVVGESACVSAANFDPEVGRQLARKDAVRKVWPLLGMELATRLATRPKLNPGCAWPFPDPKP